MNNSLNGVAQGGGHCGRHHKEGQVVRQIDLEVRHQKARENRVSRYKGVQDSRVEGGGGGISAIIADIAVQIRRHVRHSHPP